MTGVRILAVAGSYAPVVGGGEKYAAEYLRALTSRGARALVLTSVEGLEGDREVDGCIVRYVRTSRVAGFPVFGPAHLAAAVSAIGATHVQSFGPSPQDLVAAPFALARRLPYFQVYHADFRAHRPSGRIATRLHNAVVAPIARRIICTNESVADSLRSRGVPEAKILAVTPGVDEAYFEAGHGARDRDILFVGALDDGHEYKRLDLLLEALVVLRRDDPFVRLDVVGGGNRAQLFEGLAAKLGLSDAVTFHGKLAAKALLDLYGRARVFVLPSPTTQEGFGLVCLEALAAGTPVVTSVRTGVARIISEAPWCATWDAITVQDLARTIARVRSAPVVQGELQAYARRFSWQTMGDVVVRDVYRLPV